tara:strand:- start:753 stop:1022 length:270 start_codon:yes stop_codon:yes gene_type:complete
MLSEDILYKICNRFIGSNTLLILYNTNKEYNNFIKEKFIYLHYKKIISNQKKQIINLELDNYILKKDKEDISILYDDLVETLEEYMVMD